MSNQSTRPAQQSSVSHNAKRRSLFGKGHDRRTSSGDPGDLSLDSFFKTNQRGFTFGLPTASSIQKRVDRKEATKNQHQRTSNVQPSPPAVITKPLTQPSNATHTATAITTTTNEKPDLGQILKGVVAFLDTRTEDGDDVSENFEPALQSMGAKTRRTFSDSVTHVIFKKGSPATLRKALAKKVHIVNLLWVTRCKREGRRLEEKDFLIEHPQQIALTGTKRRKSMEPGKVKPLYDAETTTDIDESKQHQKRKRMLSSSASTSLVKSAKHNNSNKSNERQQQQQQQRKPPRASTSLAQRISASDSLTDRGGQQQHSRRWRGTSSVQRQSMSATINAAQRHSPVATRSKSSRTG